MASPTVYSDFPATASVSSPAMKPIDAEQGFNAYYDEVLCDECGCANFISLPTAVCPSCQKDGSLKVVTD